MEEWKVILILGDKIYKLESKSLLTKAKNSYQGELKKHPLSCYIKIVKNAPIFVKVFSDSVNLEINSNIIPVDAEKQPITKERVIIQFSKTGNSPFIFTNFDIELDDNLYLNISDLNELRRECIEKVSCYIINNFKRDIPNNLPIFFDVAPSKKKVYKKNVSLLLNILDVNTNYSELEKVDRIYIPLKYFAMSDYSNIIKNISAEFDTYIYMPTIIKSNYRNLFTNNINKALEEYDIQGFVLSNLGTFNMLEKYKDSYEFIGNYTLNVFNNYSLEAYHNLGLSLITLSPELNKSDIANISNFANVNTELIVYGSTPVMTLGYCVLGKSNKCYPNCKSLCKSKHSYYLKDRLGFYFPVIPDSVQTINTIYNSKITSIDFSGLLIDSVRIDILNENILEINEVIQTVKQEKRFEGKDYTNANFIREV